MVFGTESQLIMETVVMFYADSIKKNSFEIISCSINPSNIGYLALVGEGGGCYTLIKYLCYIQRGSDIFLFHSNCQ